MLDFLLEPLDLSEDVVSASLLNEDFFGHLDGGKSYIILRHGQLWLLILNLEAGEGSVRAA